MSNFSIRDLWNMYLSAGIRLPIRYLFECWWYDLSRSVSTHHRMMPNEFVDDPINEEKCVIYMCSWTSIVRRATLEALSRVKDQTHTPPILIDIGSGKGKTLFVWSENKKISEFSSELIGIEFSTKLVQMYKLNVLSHKSLSRIPDVVLADVLDCTLFEKDKPYILYLYNPFSEEILDKFLKKIEKEYRFEQPLIIIYNNPVHDEVFRKSKIELLCEWRHWHPNGTVNIYEFCRNRYDK
jgi:hypothetical protein